MNNKVLENRKWRYATKKFDTNKKVSEEDMKTFLEAIQLSASSYGLQPYHIFVISDKELREKLKPAAWGQSQITDASHLIIFANFTDFGEELVDNLIKKTSETRDIPIENLKDYSEMMKSSLVNLPQEQKANWAEHQAYLALGNALQAAAELKIDACPMEGYQPEEFNKILGLEEKDLNAGVIMTVGYRSEEDQYQHLAKVRRSKEELFTHI